eukprot:3201837-Pleurochrysis_carterae.AAC.1
MQADKAIKALEQPRKYTNAHIKEEEALALRQMISGIIPEWQEANDKEKKGTITIMKCGRGK